MLAVSTLQSTHAQQSASAVVSETLTNETATRAESEEFSYLSQETSTRTSGHVWTEKVVQLKSGTLQRLVAIDGAPLTPQQTHTEEQRIEKVLARPDAFRDPRKSREDGMDMAPVMMHAFVFNYASEGGSCVRVHFRPDPSFKPGDYEQRVLQALEGTVSIKLPERRVCEVDGTISHTVNVGYGLLGKVEQGGQVHLVRTMTACCGWQVTRLSIHLKGKVLMLKDISQNDEEIRTEFTKLPENISLLQAAELTKLQR